jgi:hypothetical protein
VVTGAVAGVENEASVLEARRGLQRRMGKTSEIGQP